MREFCAAASKRSRRSQRKSLVTLTYLNGNPMKTKVFYFALAVVAAAIASSCVKEQFEEPQGKPGVEITGQVFEAVGELPELGNSGQKPAQMPVAKSTLNASWKGKGIFQNISIELQAYRSARESFR